MILQDNRLQLLTMLVFIAGGALCMLLYDVCTWVGKLCKKNCFRHILDALCVALCACILLCFWYRIDCLTLRWLPVFSAVLGGMLYRVGVGFYVQLCLEKCLHTRCGGGKKMGKKT